METQKVLDYVIEGLGYLAKLLQPIRFEDVNNHSFWVGAQSLIDQDADLQAIFGGLLECITVKEEFKPEKKSKKNSNPPMENPLYGIIRSLSLKVLYNMMYPLMKTAVGNEFRLKCSSLLGFCGGLLDALQLNFSLINMDEPLHNHEAVQNCIYAASLLSFIMHTNPLTTMDFVIHPVVANVGSMCNHPLLSVSLCQIFSAISFQPSGIDFLSDQGNINVLVQIVEASKQRVAEICAPPIELPVAKGKEGKKDDKGKKPPLSSMEAVVDVYASFDYVKFEDLRKYLFQLFLMCGVFLRLSDQKPHVFEDTVVMKLTNAMKEYLLIERVWEDVCKISSTEESIGDLMWMSAQLVGRLCEISTRITSLIRTDGGMNLLISLLIKCHEVYPTVEENLWLLKRYAEKAIFPFLGESRADEGVKICRFKTASQFIVSKDLFHQFGDFTDKLIVLMASQDMDLVMRGVRISSSMLCSLVSSDNPTLISDLQLEKTLLPSLCAVCSQLLQIILEGSSSTVGVHLLDPDLENSLYLTLCGIELMISLDILTAKTFFDKERMSMMAKCISIFGPTVDNGIKETQVFIQDPRCFDWYLEKSKKYEDQSYFLRPIMIDLFRHLINMDRKFRTFETPSNNDMEIPPSSSPLEEPCFLTVKLTVDVVLHLLGGGIKWSFNEQGCLKIECKEWPVDEVIIAGLLYVQAVAELGPTVISGCIDEIFLQGYSSGVERSSLSSFRNFMSQFGNELPLDVDQSKRCCLFTDFLPANIGKPFSLEHCCSHPHIWPFFVVMGPLVGILYDRNINQEVLTQCCRAIYALIRCDKLSPSSQPVVEDILCTVALGLGGLVQFIALSGRFSKINDKHFLDDIVTYCLSRGFIREEFWVKWEQDHRVQIQIDPKTGKPIVKKDDKDKKAAQKDKKPDKNAPVIAPVFAEMQFNLESSEAFPDPNRGPTRGLWTALLNSCFPCYHILSSSTSALTSSIVSDKSSLVFPIVKNYSNFDFDVLDGYGKTPMMYALLLNDSFAVENLLLVKADLNIVDDSGIPTLLYGLCSMHPDQLQMILPGFCPIQSSDCKIVKGNSVFLSLLLGSNRIDVNVADSKGCSALLFALGEGYIEMSIGGYCFKVMNIAFDLLADPVERLDIVQMLMNYGCNIDHSAKNGKCALHIACSEGDISIVEILLNAHCNPNIVDNCGWHSVHYISACCPAATVYIMDLILKFGDMRPITASQFNDYRTGASEEVKFDQELTDYFRQGVVEAVLPLTLFAPRATLWDLSSLCTVNGLTPFLLCCIGSTCELREDIKVASDDMVHNRRIVVALHLCNIAKKAGSLTRYFQDSLHSVIKIHHAIAIALKGTTEKQLLSDKQKRSKRIRYYESEESKLLSTFLEYRDPGQCLELFCDYKVSIFSHTKWTPFHAIFANGNVFALEEYIKLLGVDAFSQIEPLRVVAQLKVPVAPDMATRLVEICSKLDDGEKHLNRNYDDIGYIIHHAIQYQQVEFARALIACGKVDLNVISSTSGLSPVQAVCRSRDIGMLELFRAASDRINLTISVHGDQSLLGWLIEQNLPHMIKLLSEIRQADVLEMLLTEDHDGSSLLKKLEQRFITLSESLRQNPCDSATKMDLADCKFMLEICLSILDAVSGFDNFVHFDSFDRRLIET